MENFDELVTERALRLSDLEAYLRLHRPPEFFRGRYVVLSTSGSTGRRGVFVYSKAEWITALASIARPIGWAGVRQLPFRRRRMAIVASSAPWHYSTRVGQSLSSPFVPALRIDAGESIGSIVHRLNEWQPEIMAVYPSLLRQLAEEQIAGRLRIALCDLATSAEVLTDDTRRRAQDAWQIHVHDVYGATEYAPIAAECSEGNMHLVEDGALIEIVDERGRPVPPGAAGERLLLTVFDRFTQPLIRYEMSDMVRPLAGDCACGRPFRLIESIEGRLEDVLSFAAREGPGTTVAIHPNIFHEVLETVPAAGWQVVQERDGLRVRLVGSPHSVSCEALTGQLRQRLDALGALVPSIRVERAVALSRGPSGKAPLIERML